MEGDLPSRNYSSHGQEAVGKSKSAVWASGGLRISGELDDAKSNGSLLENSLRKKFLQEGQSFCSI